MILWRVERKAIAKRATDSSKQSMSQHRSGFFGFCFFFNITEHSGALKSTTDETSLLQASVCFINQAAKSHHFLTEKLPAKTAVIFFLKKRKKKKKKAYSFLFKETLGNLHALERLASMSNFFHLLISHLSLQ